MKNKYPQHPSHPSIGPILVAVILSAFGSSLARANDTIQPDLDKAPITANQLSISVEQSAVPQIAVKGSASATKVRAVTIKMHRIGHGDGKVTLKIAFVGTDVTTNKKVVVSQTKQEAEVVSGKESVFTETSAPFVYNLPSVDPKTKKPIPASGTKPFGWIVRVFQGDRLLKSMSSNADLVDWINTQ